MRLDGDAWRAFFDSYESEAFRLETLPVYKMTGEESEYNEYLVSGQLVIPDDDPWLVRVRHFRKTGRWIGRVHVITRPLTDYLRYEFALYACTVRAGEDVRILDLTGKPNPGLPLDGGDFWLFDSSRVVAMRYRSDGTQISRELLDSRDLDQYRRWKDLALSLAVPFAEYKPG